MQIFAQLHKQFDGIAIVITHKRAQAGSSQCHGEGSHSHWAEIKDAWVDVQRRERLIRREN